ncbi:hypothetical protein [Streptomyces sp. NBC_01022]|uniref:hypothetical protein n=1 Tax=Streptomyces sp. NBC_01022 TaxID=2903723 RepID=UPI002DD9C2D8|nr:hypothetical protein [Streptomyces sp. NBC_01022]WRZ83133.1 hypothetical protein OG316_24130 [Streptomyces sp. NBC_01022]
MRRQTFGRPGRRGTAIAASAAVLCLGGALAGCGDQVDSDDGYTAVGAAAAGPGKAPSGAVAPSGKVTLVPLDGAGDGGGGGKDRSGASPSPGSSDATDGTGADGTGSAVGSGGSGPDTARPGASQGPARTSGASGSTGTTGGAPSSGSGSGSGSAGGSTGPTGPTGPADSPAPPSPGSTAPAGAAVLEVGAPVRAAADKRWCEKVTVEFRNTGGSPARSGTVTFATHIIGGLGIDWATRESTAPLPVPIGAGAARKMTYTVCVDAWRVPLGMHVETRDVTAVWK